VNLGKPLETFEIRRRASRRKASQRRHDIPHLAWMGPGKPMDTTLKNGRRGSALTRRNIGKNEPGDAIGQDVGKPMPSVATAKEAIRSAREPQDSTGHDDGN
jgi:hypothetical protein